MTSRLKAFALRNETQALGQDAAASQSIPQSSRDMRIHRQRQAQNPTLLDTDVESIGDTTYTSESNFQHPADEEQPRPGGDATIRLKKSASHHRKPSPSTSNQNSAPAYHAPISGPLDYTQRYDRKLAGHRETANLGRLDDVTSIPDSIEEPSADAAEHSSSEDDGRCSGIFAKSSSHEQTLQRFTVPLRSGDRDRRQNRTPSPAPAYVKVSRGDHNIARASVSDPQRPRRAIISSNPPKPWNDLDYSAEALASMPYSQLSEQPFDEDPSRSTESTEPFSLETLRDRFYVISAQDASEETKHEERLGFFSNLDIDAHEQAGELILEQFGNIVRGFRDIRRRKRQLARDYERVIAERETKAGERMKELEERTKWLKKQGEDVIRGPNR